MVCASSRSCIFRGPPAGEESFPARRGFLREPPPGQAFCPKTLGESRIVPGPGAAPPEKTLQRTSLSSPAGRHRLVSLMACLLCKRLAALSAGETQEKIPDRKNGFCQGRIYAIRGATLRSRAAPCSQRDTNISLANDVCLQRRRILCDGSHLTAPSAAHLTTCFRPGSQRPRLSVQA